ncbi:hypothetical protein A0128_05965 [Leptospira tipperaryensis]|uniref:Uncharacterized protein n=1 Tax=Leptospira tipperaryensis TaxID=2564040 RepID=A0A1D7UV00_9LEPT|nr:hypothetical protein A0128_05965 [Leptospira tipperaryensis]
MKIFILNNGVFCFSLEMVLFAYQFLNPFLETSKSFDVSFEKTKKEFKFLSFVLDPFSRREIQTKVLDPGTNSFSVLSKV